MTVSYKNVLLSLLHHVVWARSVGALRKGPNLQIVSERNQSANNSRAVGAALRHNTHQ